MVRSHFLSTNTSRDPVSSKLRQTGRVVSSWGGEKRVERYRGRRRRRRRIVAGSLTSSTPFFRPMFASCIWLGNTKGLTYTYESSSPFLPPSLSPPHSQPARCGGRSWRRSSALSPGRRRAHTRKFLVPGENLVEQPRRGSKRYERCSLDVPRNYIEQFFLYTLLALFPRIIRPIRFFLRFFSIRFRPSTSGANIETRTRFCPPRFSRALRASCRAISIAWTTIVADFPRVDASSSSSSKLFAPLRDWKSFEEILRRRFDRDSRGW